MRTALRDIEAVVHLGGIDRSFITDDAATMQVNAMGTWNLFKASLQIGIRRVIHCSSSSVLGLDSGNPHMPPCYMGERHMNLTNQVALVTGVGQGIGKASALALVEAGRVSLPPTSSRSSASRLPCRQTSAICGTSTAWCARHCNSSARSTSR